ncbi:MAG TPA: hypothetical protein VMG59_00085 [Phycisphaerae bacterium]|nr:hypothetical protein [Phycisphaerae bacterium]
MINRDYSSSSTPAIASMSLEATLTGWHRRGRPLRHRSATGFCKPALSLFLAANPVYTNADAISIVEML